MDRGQGVEATVIERTPPVVWPAYALAGIKKCPKVVILYPPRPLVRGAVISLVGVMRSCRLEARISGFNEEHFVLAAHVTVTGVIASRNRSDFALLFPNVNGVAEAMTCHPAPELRASLMYVRN